jgi:hypothetical protein
MLQNRRWNRRRGSTLVEFALVVTVFLTLILGVVDLATFVTRLNAVNQAARLGVRAGSVHGLLAITTWNGGPWGPSQYGPSTVSTHLSDPQVVALLPALGGLNTSTVQVTYSWPDGSNATEKNVRVTVSATWTPTVSMIFGVGTRTVTAASTMPIAH